MKKNISILVPRGAASLGCIEGSFILFSRANEMLKGMGKTDQFEIQLVGLNRSPQVYDKLLPYVLTWV